MTTAVQRRRGTNTEHASFTGLEGEISVNTTNESVHVHDGSTAGGFELMRADGANSTVTLGDISGVTAGTGLSGGGTTGTVTLDIDGTVATLAGTQTFTNKTLTSPILNTPTIGTSFTIGGATITETELEILDGATVTTTELNYVDGVTSAIQTQIDAKAPLASPSFTGNVSVGGTVDGRDLAADGTKLDLINQGVATTDSPAFAGLTVDTTTLAVDSTNNRVGIGTASPSENLAVESGSNNAILLNSPANRYNAVGFQSAGVDKWWMGRADTDIIAGDAFFIGADAGNATDAGGTNAKLVIDSSGKVGIGTPSPATALDTNGIVRASSAYSLSYAGVDGSTSAFGAGTISADANWGMFFKSTTGASVAEFAWFNAAGTERMRIDSSGNVGIGTSTMYGRTNSIPKAAYNAAGTNWAESAYTAAGSWGGGYSLIDGSAGYLLAAESAGTNLVIRQGTVGSTPTERMRIDSSGNVGIGTSSILSTAKLHVRGGCYMDGSYDSTSVWNANKNTQVALSSFASGANPTYEWNNSRYSYKFENFNNCLAITVGGTSNDRNANIQVGHEASGTYAQYYGSLYLNKLGGTVYANTSSISDERYKTNITNVDNALAKVTSLNGCTFHRTDVDVERQQAGVIAQQVEAVLPSAVVYDEQEDKYAVSYHMLSALYVEAFKELKTKTEQLETQNSSQATQIADLINRIAALEE